MAKQYGLILPGKYAIFGCDSDSGNESPIPKAACQGPSSTQKRQARLQHEKALAEDPTIFQYDELYDEMESKKVAARTAEKKSIQQGPKYIERLLETAEKRKKEYERRIERQVQKERDEEGEQFKDKDSFVTASYKRKLDEMRAAELDEEKKDQIDSTNQKDFDGFYRHLFGQKIGDTEAVSSSISSTSQRNQTRQYRQQNKCPMEFELTTQTDRTDDGRDADSDFSIDSTDSEETAEEVRDKAEPLEAISGGQEDPFVKIEAQDETLCMDKNRLSVEKAIEPTKKVDIWEKRTVGEVLLAAKHRYAVRKCLPQTEI